MPYKKGYSKSSVSANIRTFKKEGDSQEQAVAKALSIAETAKKKASRLTNRPAKKHKK